MHYFRQFSFRAFKFRVNTVLLQSLTIVDLCDGALAHCFVQGWNRFLTTKEYAISNIARNRQLRHNEG